jgi:excinuclease ABC subunit C
LEGLRKRRDLLAKELRFEEAAKIRDEIEAIEKLSAKQRIVNEEGVDQDVLGIAEERGKSCVVVLNIRDGKLIGERHFFLESPVEEEKERILEDFLKQYYLRADMVPEEILLPQEIPDQKMVEEWLRRRAHVELKAPKRGKKFDLLRLAKKNADLLLAQKLLLPSPLEDLRKLLRLAKLPMRIEAVDVSNIKGSFATASLVVFEEGNPKKEEYRHFRIKGVKGSGDPKMIEETLERRFRRLLRESVPLPDLVVVDGGRPQLNAAINVLSRLGVEGVCVVGVAKADERKIYLSNRKEPILPKKEGEGLRLLTHIMDEAHRFAHTYHIKLRKKG